MRNLYCGYCFSDAAPTAPAPSAPANAPAGADSHAPLYGSCLQTDYNNYVHSTVGRCNVTVMTSSTTAAEVRVAGAADVTWAYDYCPTDFAWMAVAGLVLYLIFFAPGTTIYNLTARLV